MRKKVDVYIKSENEEENRKRKGNNNRRKHGRNELRTEGRKDDGQEEVRE
jgi:hypothetical protein